MRRAIFDLQALPIKKQKTKICSKLQIKKQKTKFSKETKEARAKGIWGGRFSKGSPRVAVGSFTTDGTRAPLSIAAGAIAAPMLENYAPSDLWLAGIPKQKSKK